MKSDEPKNKKRRGFLQGAATGSAALAAGFVGTSLSPAVQAGGQKTSRKEGVLVVFRSRVKPEYLETLTEYAAGRTLEAREFEGCIDVDIYFDVEDPHHLWTVGFWESIEHNKRYMEWRGETGVKANIFEMLEEEERLIINYLTRVPVEQIAG